MNNTILRKQDIEEVTLDTFKEAIFLSYKDGITSVAPLGFSGDTIIIHQFDVEKGRSAQVSIRNYVGDPELLITDKEGNFIFYGRYHLSLGLEWIASEYYRIFEATRGLITGKLSERPEFSNVKNSENVEYSEGFKMLKIYMDSDKPMAQIEVKKTLIQGLKWWMKNMKTPWS